ncbi:MAG: hypothetical protein FWE17_01735, partial [Alphaproteobacteria bacterium]|nr:hypothetical protein [Alphaproteobacteria bacterium]
MLEQIKNIKSLEELAALHAATFGKNGTMTSRLKDMKRLDNNTRIALNTENAMLREAFKNAQEELENAALLSGLELQKLDAAAPFDNIADFGAGRLHPL